MIVALLGLADIAAQIQNRQIQQPLLDQEQNVDDAPGAAIAVIERVDGRHLLKIWGL